MSGENRKFDRYNEIFKSVLSEDSDLPLNLEDKNEPSVTTEVDVKKRKRNLDKNNLKLKQATKKRKETAKDRLLKWNRFYMSNSFGIWVQCTKCNKWRNVMEYEEEHEIPDDWCCSMSLSGTRSCNEPEDTENVEFSPVNFIPGTIVWARYNGYPWSWAHELRNTVEWGSFLQEIPGYNYRWPGMIEDDPDVEEYYWIEKNGKCSYNITFLDDKVTHAWVSSSFVRHFLDPPKLKYQPKGYAKYSPLLAAAEIKAKQAMRMSIQERLQKFSFAHQYKGKWGSPLPSDDSDEGEKDLTQMLLEEMDDIESVRSADSDYKSVNSFELKKDGTNNKFSHCEISSKDNSEHKTNRANTNKLTDTQSKKESESTNGDNVAVFKEKVNEKANSINELIDEIIYLDEILPDTTETFVESKRGKCIDSKLKNAKTTKDVTSSEKTEKDIKDNSKNEKTLIKTSKTKNKKADKLENLNTKENQDQREPRILKKHIADASVMNEMKKQNHIEKTLNNSSNSKFKPPVKNNKVISCEDNHSSKSINNKKIATNVNNLDPTIEEENLVKKEISKRNLEENKHLDKTSVIWEKTPKNVENNRSSKENVKCENNMKGNNIAETLEKNLKNSLERKSISMQENKNCTSYDSKGTLHAENSKDDKKQKKKVCKKNFEEALTSSDVPDNNENYNIRSKSTTIQKKKNILKADSSTEDLPVSNAGSSELTDTFKCSARQNASKTEKKGKKCFKSEIKNESEEMKQKQENEMIFASDNKLKDISCNGNTNEEKFSLSLKMNSQESEEDSDPFEA